MKPFIIVFFILMSIVAHSKTIEFELKALPTARSNSQEIKKGLLDLYRQNISEEELTKQVSLAEEFQNTIYSAIEKKISDNKIIKAEVTERTLKGNIVKETIVRFPSLIQRKEGHAANQVVAKIYTSTTSRAYCEYRYPTTIFLHHILNELPMIEDAAKVMASGIVHQAGIVVVLHMPHYGERHQEGEEFLNPDLASFRQNVAQLILDTHMLRNFLETRDNVNTEKLSLTGISLGAVMGLTVGAFDQGFSGGYGSLVGGTDMANILFNRATTRKDSEVAIALKGLKMDETLIRNELAAADSMTWLHRYQNKRIFALNASRDDIINYDISVKPMLAILKLNNNQVIERLNDDTHSPTGSIFKKLKNVFNPMMEFVVDKSPSFTAVCPLKGGN